MARVLLGFWVTAANHPSHVALIEPGGAEITYGELLGRVNRLSNALVSQGISAGGHVAVLSWNRAEILVLALAVAQIGATFTPLDAHGTAPEIAGILQDRPPLALFVEAKTAAVAHAAAEQAQLDSPTVNFDAVTDGVTLADWTTDMSAAAPAVRLAGGAVLYTSGTSGKPKGVVRELDAVEPERALDSFALLLTRFGIDPAEHQGKGVQLVTSPLYHAAPLHIALLALHIGHTIVIMDRFVEEYALELVERHRVTWTHVVPTMMRRWMRMDADKRASYDVSSLEWFIHAAAPCPAELKREVIDWLGPIVYEYYASTEIGGAAISTEEWLAHPGSVGKPWPGADIKILNAAAEQVAAGEVGNVYLRLARAFTYHNDPAKTAESTDGDYFTVGDLGWLDHDGYLYIADRRSDLILVGGANVYPAEVESALLRHDEVLDVAVIGIPHSDRGQVVHAFVQPRDGINERELITSLEAWAQHELGSQKRPLSYEIVSSIPRSEMGKLMRRKLRPAP
ncbi:AMP-binding protein [Nocardia salmonicida]|uniref:AMP-binding protein n=1 Tax=Nocardia salmonicida TaxID=53431 RepID=UPI0033E566EC